MSNDPYKPPMQAACKNPNTPRHVSRFAPQLLIVELAIVGAIFSAAAYAVPVLYGGRSSPKWISGMVAFSVFPALAGGLWGRPLYVVTLSTAAFAVGCVIVGALFDPLPTDLQRVYDIITLAMSSTVVFVSAGWIRNLLATQKWWQLAFAGLSLLVGAGTAAVLVSVFMFLE